MGYDAYVFVEVKSHSMWRGVGDITHCINRNHDAYDTVAGFHDDHEWVNKEYPADLSRNVEKWLDEPYYKSEAMHPWHAYYDDIKHLEGLEDSWQWMIDDLLPTFAERHDWVRVIGFFVF